jgi:para-aminobenzoate synthetase component I
MAPVTGFREPAPAPRTYHRRVDVARFGDRVATRVREVRTGAEALEALDGQGFWAVVVTFEGAVTAVRFADVRRPAGADPSPGWSDLKGPWRTSLDADAYRAAVVEIRERIAAGEVYQANLCRVLEHDLDETADLDGLDAVLRRGNPAPYACRIRVDVAGLDVVSASPERFLHRSGERLVSAPIKGTARTAEGLLPKDFAENVMIVDLVRNDLSRVCHEGTVDVEALCAVERHPGLVHLVSTVAGRLRPDVGWPQIMAATFPPGSVSGAPKSSALRTIRDLEAVARGPYCGAVGWVDADRGEAELAVGIRTFWAQRSADGRRVLRFGTGAGITWGSDPDAEWAETELKAARLVGLTGTRRAARTTAPGPTPPAGPPPPRRPVGAAPRRPR